MLSFTQMLQKRTHTLYCMRWLFCVLPLSGCVTHSGLTMNETLNMHGWKRWAVLLCHIALLLPGNCVREHPAPFTLRFGRYISLLDLRNDSVPENVDNDLISMCQRASLAFLEDKATIDASNSLVYVDISLLSAVRRECEIHVAKQVRQAVQPAVETIIYLYDIKSLLDIEYYSAWLSVPTGLPT